MFPCPAGTAVSFELKASGDTHLKYFQDWNPSPIGLYITKCLEADEGSLNVRLSNTRKVKNWLIVGLPSTFASLTVGETKCPAKPSVPARICM